MIISKRRAGFRLSRSLILLVCTVFTCVYLLHGNTASLYISTTDFSAGTLLRFSKPPRANATLGFGAIAAVSKTNSSRRDGLLLAADITGLDITIPVQQEWTDDDIALVKAQKGSLLSRGSALAWLGHLNLLNWFLSTDLETVLILEDDVDWDIHLRTTQIPRVAATVRHLLTEKRGTSIRKAPTPAKAGGYWGDPNQWDILYLGHCGDEIKPGKWNFRVQRASFYDSTLPRRQELEKKTRKMLNSIAMPEYTRSVHQSIEPLCTFGFAISRSAAKMLLYDYALREPDGGVKAYDVRVLEACRDLGFRCWSSTPELFHHMHKGSEIAGVDKRPKGLVESSSTSTTNYPLPTASWAYRPKHSTKSAAPSSTAISQQAWPSGINGFRKTEMANGAKAVVGQAVSVPASQETGAVPSHSQAGLGFIGPAPHSVLDDPLEEDDDLDYRDGHWEDDDEDDDDELDLPPDDPRRTSDVAPNIACGARWFKARNDAELAMLREVVGNQGRCIHQEQDVDGDVHE